MHLVHPGDNRPIWTDTDEPQDMIDFAGRRGPVRPLRSAAGDPSTAWAAHLKGKTHWLGQQFARAQRRSPHICWKPFCSKRGIGDSSIGAKNVNVFGGAAHDFLFGSKCSDVMVGYAGNDTMYGGGGNDQLYAGSGNDVLIGGAGSDLLKGEGGADLFLFSIGDGRGAGDRILDFSEGDRIGFVKVSERTVSQAVNADGNLEIYYGALGGPSEFSNRITLEGVHHLLAAKDFVFF
jgi:hypothetical protein